MAVDNSPWDGNRAMGECSTAAEYRKIAFEKTAGEPDERQHYGLPHHYLSKAPTPNAAGVRAALSRFSQTQGLSDAGAARRHLEAHMTSIQSDRESASVAITDERTLLTRMPVEQWEIRHSGRPDEEFTVRGYAGVFSVLSHDMGGFRIMLDPHSMDEVLATDPDVHFVWDHDTRYVGARTANGTLKLSADETGLYMDAQVGNYSWAKDLRRALERGDIDQGSISIRIGEDDWSMNDDGEVIRTVTQVEGLHDVTVTAQGAFPQTNLEAALSLVRGAVSDGRLPEAGAAIVAQLEGGQSSQEGDSGEVVRRAEELQHLLSVRRDELAELRKRAEQL